MFKNDAKKAFSITEAESFTIPHESIAGSPKTYFAIETMKALQQRRVAAGAIRRGLGGQGLDVYLAVYEKYGPPLQSKFQANYTFFNYFEFPFRTNESAKDCQESSH
ncbi:hypothetical protein GGX14DRAFT_579735 [Mycena pura]|uniref:Uncharacterized protein n=1 Tax=Mycena pura TaxID=153505 RepID=A0AAD6UQC2_9AGAR|nr:hypothetical protein GGX14DRAFT_579735 [Mycena pura]